MQCTTQRQLIVHTRLKSCRWRRCRRCSGCCFVCSSSFQLRFPTGTCRHFTRQVRGEPRNARIHRRCLLVLVLKDYPSRGNRVLTRWRWGCCYCSVGEECRSCCCYCGTCHAFSRRRCCCLRRKRRIYCKGNFRARTAAAAWFLNRSRTLDGWWWWLRRRRECDATTRYRRHSCGQWDDQPTRRIIRHGQVGLRGRHRRWGLVVRSWISSVPLRTTRFSLLRQSR